MTSKENLPGCDSEGVAPCLCDPCWLSFVVELFCGLGVPEERVFLWLEAQGLTDGEGEFLPGKVERHNVMLALWDCYQTWVKVQNVRVCGYFARPGLRQ